MGNGRSRNYYSRTIGGLTDKSEDKYESILKRDEELMVYDYLYYDVYGISDDLPLDKKIDAFLGKPLPTEVSEQLTEELRKSGTKVNLTGNAKEILTELGISPKLQDAIINLVGSDGSDLRKKVDGYVYGTYNPRSLLEEKALDTIARLPLSDTMRIYSLSSAGDLQKFLSSTDEDMIGSAYSAINAQLSTLSKLNGTLNGLGYKSASQLSYNNDSNNVAGSYNISSGINVNPRGLVNFEDLNQIGDRNTVHTWSVGMFFPQTTIIHEFGHHVHHVVFRNKDVVKGASAVSTYGNSNYHEAFAEAFSSYCLGVHPVNGSEYYANFRNLMQEKGLSVFEGMFSPSGLRQQPKSSVTKVTTPKVTPIKAETPKVSTPKTPTIKTNTPKVRTASNFTKSSTSISGTIRGKNFTATITEGIRNRGYIERTVGSTKYRIDINTGAFTKID